MRKSTTDFAAGIATLAVAAAFQFQTGDLEGVSLYFPRILIIFLTLGGLILLVQAFMRRRKEEPTAGEALSLSRLAYISLGSIVYALLIPVLGFYPMSAVFLFAMAIILHQDKFGEKAVMLSALFFTMIMIFIVWGGFSWLLGVPTPEGMFFVGE